MLDAAQLQVGCVLEGSRGWRITADLITDVASPLGFFVSDQDLYMIGAYNHNLPAHSEDGKHATDPVEYVIDLADQAEEWLNENTPSGLAWHWHDGEFFLSLVCVHCGEVLDDDGTVLVDETGSDACDDHGTRHCTGFVVDETVDHCATCFLTREDHEDDLTVVSVEHPERSIEGFAVFIEHTRMGPTVRVGPFESAKAAFAWIDARSPDTVWSIVALQDPVDPATPDWN